jgi:glycosyltransferase involved in cell wall biosynthesis
MKYGELMGRADRVFAPTQRCRDVYLEYFPGLAVKVAYHPEWEQSYPYADPVVPQMTSDEKLKVLVVGALSREKGADVLERTATYRDPLGRLEYHLLGYAYRPLAPEVIQHGPYDDLRLDSLIADLKPDLFWFPAQWHETYCYALSAALRSGLPILASDLGSFPERLEGRPLSFIRPWRSTPIEWNDTLLQIRDWLLANQSYRADWQQVSMEDYGFLYSRDYVVKTSLERAVTRLPSLEKVTCWSYPHAGGEQKLSSREKLLAVLIRLRELPGVHHLLRIIPFEVQRNIKRKFSHRPIHDIVNGQK